MKRIMVAADIGQQGMRLPGSYLRALRQVGAIGGVGFADTREDAAAYGEMYDGLILPGGGDLPAEMFGQTNHVACQMDDPARDASDRLLLEAFMAAGKRVLGICRGCQAANVFLGGSLHQHLPDAFDPVLWHAGNITGRHDAAVKPGSLLHRLMGDEHIQVNSSHHQAVDKPGQGLTIVAHAPDGVVEALEGENLLLLQWHPERMMESMAPLFRWLIGAK